jgi:hypothetical protein
MRLSVCTPPSRHTFLAPYLIVAACLSVPLTASAAETPAQGAPIDTSGRAGLQRDAGDVARAQRWIRLSEAIGEIPQPPSSVSQASRYDRHIAPKLEALQQELDHWEAQLEKVDEALEAGGEAAMAASFAATQRQGAVARQRRNERTTPASNAQDSRETETMRSTLPAQFDGFNAQRANASLFSFLQTTAFQRAREEQEVKRLDERHTQEVNACDAPDAACATAADRAHHIRLSSFKDPIYQRGVTAWNSLHNEIKRLAAPLRRGVTLLANDGRWLLGRTGDKQGKPLDVANQSGPLRTFVGLFAALLSSSRDRWEEAKSIHDLQAPSSNGN